MNSDWFNQEVKRTEFNYTILDGKVYLDPEAIEGIFREVAQYLFVNGAFEGDLLSMGSAQGFATAADTLVGFQSEALRRETEAILSKGSE